MDKSEKEPSMRGSLRIVIDLLIEQQFISSSQETRVFDEFSLLSNYITGQKINDWNTGNIATENCWVEVFIYFRVPC